MRKTIHAISGLPRSGSTMLSAILLQNPRFHASISSPMLGMASSLIGHMSAGSEASSLIDINRRGRIIRGFVDGFHAGLPGDIAMDTNRLWTSRMELLKLINPDAKVIACVRDIPSVINSFEVLYRKTPTEFTKLFSPDTRTTVFSRSAAMMQDSAVIGAPWLSLKDGIFGPYAKDILIVEYEMLAKIPRQTVDAIYEFIGEDKFSHDFNSLVFDTPDYDIDLGVRGLHTVRKKVEYLPENMIIPPEICERYAGMSFWRDCETEASRLTVE